MTENDEPGLANTDVLAPPDIDVGRGALVEVVDVVEETTDAVSVTFVPSEGDDHKFRYEPGQFLTLRLPTLPEPVSRSYSLSSAPGLSTGLTVTIKRVPTGVGSNWLCDNAIPGLRLPALPPSGRFVLGAEDQDVVLVGAGSGITPLMSIAKTVLSRLEGRVFLIYANRDAASVIFARALHELQDAHPGRLQVVHWLEELQGLPTAAKLSALFPRESGARIFVCGPGPFMAVAKEAAHTAGIPRDRILSEVFVSLSGDAFAVPVLPSPGDESGQRDEARVEAAIEAARGTVLLDGTITEFDWPRCETLVDTLVSLGVDVPYTCREGDCGSCTGLLKRGEVDPGANDILDPDDIAEGYILACQARPVSDDLYVTF